MASASTIWDEGVNGDLSSNRSAPTNLNLAVGTNSLFATTNSTDIDYVHFHLSAGMSLESINFMAWTGSDQKGFIGVQAGSTFTEPPTGTNVANLLGYAHFGPGVNVIGQDILPSIGQGAGSIGFSGALTGSDYTFWLNQTNPSPQSYQLDFVTRAVPEPVSFIALLGASLFIKRKRKA